MRTEKPLSLGQKVQQLRRARQLTQQQLAAQAGIALSTLTKLEGGVITSPSAKVLQKIVSVLKYDLDELLSSNPLPSPTQRVKSNPSIKFIYFDVGGVLVHAQTLIIQEISKQLGKPYAKVAAVYHQYQDLACLGRMSLNDWQLLMLIRLNADYKAAKAENFFVHWVNHMKPIKETHQLAHELAQTYPIGLLTNMVNGSLARIKNRRLIPSLKYHAIIDSSAVGLIKPDPAIYELATERAGVKPDQILFIDDIKVNVRAAREAGWQAVWFNETNCAASVARIRRKYF
jgi:epoxide hydrolase-like predicted phosphatase